MAQLASQLSGTGVSRSSGRYSLQRINAIAERRKTFRFDAMHRQHPLHQEIARSTPTACSGGWTDTFRGCSRAGMSWRSGGDAGDAPHARGTRGGTRGARREFLHLQNLALTWVVFVFVKTIHEFGHGLTCKHFGGEVHEMGAMFIMFTPYLYCNVSDSWLLPDKTRRILVTAAGIFVEMSLAIVAAWVWSVTAPGCCTRFASTSSSRAASRRCSSTRIR